MECPFQCDCKGLLRRDLGKHERVCVRVIVPCPNRLRGCSLVVPFSLPISSPFSWMVLAGTNTWTAHGIERRELEKHVSTTCPVVLVNCRLCKKATMRKDLRGHETMECLERIVWCPYERFGCKVAEMPYRLMKGHLEADVAKHLEFTTDCLENMESVVRLLVYFSPPYFK